MCGINGIIGIHHISEIEKRILKMNDLISHRGPDAGEIQIISKRVALGHRRLSIIDPTERSNQPMTSNSKRWTVVFNGEIYNFQDLKKNLEYNFYTNSDTEVILAYVETYGVDAFLKECNGMFAIGLFDNVEEKLYLIRDRLGIKPLHYALTEEAVLFSSEIKGILGSGLISPSFNEDAIDEYLGNRYVRAPYTFFKDIFQLEAGHYLTLDRNMRVESYCYWELPTEFNLQTNYDEEEISKKFEIELREAIERRLVSDVPLGTYLSGGVDSSLITAITTKLLNKPVHTYTIGFNNLNEFGYANRVADQYNTVHHQTSLSKDNYFDLMEEIIRYKDAPLGVPNEIPLAHLSREIKKNITVILSGEGADELLGGYGRIFRTPFDYKNHNIDTNFYNYFINNYEYVPRDIRDTFLNTSKRYRLYFDQKLEQDFKMHSNEENVFRFFHTYHVKGLLQRVDTTTMLAGVEARVPFLDYKLVEYSYKYIPYSLKLRWKDSFSKNSASKAWSNEYSEDLDIPKYILKKISYKYLPKEIIERKKMGFPVPLNDWIDLLEEGAVEILKEASWLKQDMLIELIEKSRTNERAGQVIWMFINVELFRRNYFSGKFLRW